MDWCPKEPIRAGPIPIHKIRIHIEQDSQVIGLHFSLRGFPDSSAGKESACNAEDPGSIPGSGRSAGEGISYPLQCSCAS